MNVLFVSSGNSKAGISIITYNQGESLRKAGIDIRYFTIKGKGLSGYIKNIFPLRKYLRTNRFDVVHAHYSLSAFTASLAGAKPLVVSLMGSDIRGLKCYRLMMKLFNYLSWDKVIVKSFDMKRSLGFGDCEIIPNGVDFQTFKPRNKNDSITCTGLSPDNKNIIFAAKNPGQKVKNFMLAEKSVSLIKNKNVKLIPLSGKTQQELVDYYNAADLLLLTSLSEGSPNVIKEAMACNLPVVSTDVGDVKELIGNMEGCYITSFDPEDAADKIKKALDFGKRTKGRENIRSLDVNIIAEKIIKVYEEVLEKSAKAKGKKD